MPIPEHTSLPVRLIIADELMRLSEQPKQQRLRQLRDTLENGGMHVEDLLPRTGVIIGHVADQATMERLRRLPDVLQIKVDRPVSLPSVFRG